MDSMLIYYLKGIAMGFVIATPIGAVSVFCIEKTISEGRLAGFITGLGSSLADLLVATVVAFGIGKITDMLLNYWWIRGIGALVLLSFCVRMLLVESVIDTAKRPPVRELESDFLSAFVMNIFNPGTIIGYIVAFYFFGPGAEKIVYSNTFITIAGVVCGSVLWWYVFSYVVSIYRHRVHKRGMKWINIITAIILGTISLATLYSLVVL